MEALDAEVVHHGERLGDEVVGLDRALGHRRLTRAGELDHHVLVRDPGSSGRTMSQPVRLIVVPWNNSSGVPSPSTAYPTVAFPSVSVDMDGEGSPTASAWSESRLLAATRRLPGRSVVMHRMTRSITAVMILASAASLAACGGDADGATEPADDVVVDEVSADGGGGDVGDVGDVGDSGMSARSWPPSKRPATTALRSRSC